MDTTNTGKWKPTNGQHVSWFRPSIVGSIFVVTSVFIVISNSFFGWLLDSCHHHNHHFPSSILYNGQIFTLIGYILTLISLIIVGPIYPITFQANIFLILLAQSLLGISFSIHLISSFTLSFQEALYVYSFCISHQLFNVSCSDVPSFQLKLIPVHPSPLTTDHLVHSFAMSILCFASLIVHCSLDHKCCLVLPNKMLCPSIIVRWKLKPCCLTFLLFLSFSSQEKWFPGWPFNLRINFLPVSISLCFGVSFQFSRFQSH